MTLKSAADRFHRQAVECKLNARKAMRPLDREAWLRLAADWAKLAQGAELAGQARAVAGGSISAVTRSPRTQKNKALWKNGSRRHNEQDRTLLRMPNALFNLPGLTACPSPLSPNRDLIPQSNEMTRRAQAAYQCDCVRSPTLYQSAMDGIADLRSLIHVKGGSST
jgi:hypothetical protein